MKQTLKEQTKKWGPKIAFFAVFGFTGIAAVGIYKGIQKVRDMEFDWDDISKDY
jgi:hypothetical protein